MALLAFKIFDAVPVRLNLWVMMFTACWVSYMLRVNMSLNLIAMVPKDNSPPLRSAADLRNSSLGNDTLHHVDIADVREAPRPLGPSNTFDWSAEKQALILGSYFWSYPITSLFGGMAAERWGPRNVVLLSSVSSGILTLVCPLAANWSYVALVVVRFMLGFAGGFVYPALHSLIAHWVPPAEKGKFISSLMGGTLGTVLTWTLTGPLMEKYGWESAFYMPAAITLVWCGIWWYLVADTPSDHPRITPGEKAHIAEQLGDKVSKKKTSPPFKAIATSIPFLAMVVLHFGNLWGLYFIMTAAPKFVSSVLGFNLSSAGFVAALPYLARLVFATIFGSIGDFITARKLMSATMIRKSFCLFSHILPGLLLVALVYASSSTELSVALITMSMGSNGAATLTNLQNHQDLAPNFAGTLYGIANCIGGTTGFFSPMITAHFTKTGNTFENWRPVFYVGASVYIVAAVVFLVLGTGATQRWNYSAEEQQARASAPNEMNNTAKQGNTSK